MVLGLYEKDGTSRAEDIVNYCESQLTNRHKGRESAQFLTYKYDGSMAPTSITQTSGRSQRHCQRRNFSALSGDLRARRPETGPTYAKHSKGFLTSDPPFF
jgi:hypothetical protein